MLDANICSDGLAMGNSLVVAAVNPLRLYVINDLDLSEEVRSLFHSVFFLQQFTSGEVVPCSTTVSLGLCVGNG